MSAEIDASDEPDVCPSEWCPMCNGEACNLCGAGCSPTDLARPLCEHDVIQRHGPYEDADPAPRLSRVEIIDRAFAAIRAEVDTMLAVGTEDAEQALRLSGTASARGRLPTPSGQPVSVHATRAAAWAIVAVVRLAEEQAEVAAKLRFT